MMRFPFLASALLCTLISSPSGAADAPRQDVTLLDLESSVPAEWIAETPASSMRLLQFRVPRPSESAEAQFVVYYFGQGQGGSAEANIARWRSQFTGPDGGPVEPVVTESRETSVPFTLVELRGDYARRIGVGPGDSAQPDQVLLAAIVETEHGNLFVQLHGPRLTVDAQRGALEGFLDGLHTNTGNP